MEAITTLKQRLIDQIMLSNNEDLLDKINSLFDENLKETKVLNLSSEQIEMLSLSEEDIKYNRIVSAEELDKRDAEWQE